MFGPARPHWLEQASNAFRRRPKDHAQSKWSSPPMRMYANAIYYPNYRASIECPPSSLRCDIISHIFYAFAAISESGEVYLDNHETDCNISIDGTQGCLRALAQLKSRYGHLKLILSVGGAKGNKTAFSNASSDESRRSRFAMSARCLVDRYYFDGIDVDWEHPENWEGENYVQLMACLRYHLPAPRYIVSTALPAGEWVLSRYDLPRLASSIDFLNLMAYDFTGDWGDPKISGHHAQLYANHGGGSTHPAIDYILGKGFPPNKILLGCPCYGWSFLNCNNINQPCENCGGAGGAFDYKDLPRPGTQECVDEGPVAAFCVGGDGGFVTYDNVDTVAAKAGYAKRRGLGGIFFGMGSLTRREIGAWYTRVTRLYMSRCYGGKGGNPVLLGGLLADYLSESELAKFVSALTTPWYSFYRAGLDPGFGTSCSVGEGLFDELSAPLEILGPNEVWV